MPRVPERVRWAVAQLERWRDAPLLEVGCGTGQAVALVAERLRRGNITGIDRSATQVSRARTLNAESIAAGRARVEHVALETAHDMFGERAFRAVLAINVNEFWTRPGRALDAARRLLGPGGALYLFYEPPSAAGLARLKTLLPALIESTGFELRWLRTAALAQSHVLGLLAGLP
jgi:SAM-dependent methyltransferase